jgi:small-conductance mechanosensitive channel
MERLSDAVARAGRLLAFTPDWMLSALFLLFAAALAWYVHALLYQFFLRFVPNESIFWRSMAARLRLPARFAMIMAAIALAASLAPPAVHSAAPVRHLMLLGFIALLGWLVITALHIWTVLYLRRFELGSEDNLLARKHITQTRILERTANVVVVVITLSAALMTFNGVRQYGISLLASAGAAGLVIGLALQPMLKNLIAGIQIAVTQPIRIDDALLIEGEWGNVEEITSSYVVIRIWDWRRLIVPLSHFIEQPFQNWTREGAALIGSVILYTDFTVPIEEVRQKLEEIVRTSRLWDGRVVNLQITDFKETTMEIRMLVSARNSGNTFDLRCEVREKMISYLQQRHPRALPRVRAELASVVSGHDARVTSALSASS